MAKRTEWALLLCSLFLTAIGHASEPKGLAVFQWEAGYLAAIQQGGSTRSPVFRWTPEYYLFDGLSIGARAGAMQFTSKSNTKFNVFEYGATLGISIGELGIGGFAGFQDWTQGNGGTKKAAGAQLRYIIAGGFLVFDSLFVDVTRAFQSVKTDSVAAGARVSF